VPYAPGGSTDPISRKYAELLDKQLKVKVIVENKPGASATIGTGAVIRAAPDGYTIGLGSTSSLAYQPLEMKGLAWKSADDYQSIAKLSDLPAILAVPADARWKTFDDFIAGKGQSAGERDQGAGGHRIAPRTTSTSSSSTSSPAPASSPCRLPAAAAKPRWRHWAAGSTARPAMRRA
jgi:tripartite-type tricarboxylate transporter receptor subunit TctC